MDKSNGYEEIAHRFMALRNLEIGAALVREWSRTLRQHASVLDLGCGHGEPVARILIEYGCNVFAVDASQSLLEEFRKRFPAVATEHATVEESEFFRRTFDGIVSVGLLFLLPPETQATAIGKVANALRPEGKFLFTAPREAVRWSDAMTGCESISLGSAEYQRILETAGLQLDAERTDEGENHYYFASKTTPETV